jgi:hypothetical protein
MESHIFKEIFVTQHTRRVIYHTKLPTSERQETQVKVIDPTTRSNHSATTTTDFDGTLF